MSTTIGDRIAHIRGDRSRADFAKTLGVHKNTLGNYERGERTPDAAFLQKLMDYGVNANWVLTGEGPMYREANPDAHQQQIDQEPGRIERATDSNGSPTGSSGNGVSKSPEGPAVAISPELAESVVESMIKYGVIKKECRVSVAYFTRIYNRVVQTPGLVFGIERAVQRFMLDYYHQRLEDIDAELSKVSGDEYRKALQLMRDHYTEQLNRFERLIDELCEKSGLPPDW